MLKSKQKLNLKKTLRIFDKFLSALIKFIHGHKQTCVGIFIVFLGSPLNFDKEKWY